MERSGRYRVEARGATPPTTQLPGERGSARAAPPTRSTGARAGANRRLRPSSVQQRGRSRSAIAEAAWLRIANGESGDAIGRDATRTPVSECSSRRPGCRSRWSPWRAAARHAGARRTARVRHGEQVLRSRIRRTLVGEARDRHTFPWNPGFRLPSADGIAARVGEGHPRVQRPPFPAPECSADAAAALGAKRSGEREARPSGRVCRPTTPGKPPRSVRCVPASYSALGPLNSAPAA
jgi:hypothetical protein